jgi:two-component system sensor histidine kinase MprB
LAHVVATSVGRARRRAPSVTFVANVEECLVAGQAAMLERAVTNVLDNAAKWSPPGGQVDVALHDREIVIRDRGPGIAADDVPHVFARFYRSPAARSMPGSGLGLAIVHDVMSAHGGTATVEPAPDEAGGTVVRLQFPVQPTA